MKKILLITVIILSITGITSIQQKKINKLKNKNQTLHGNVEALIEDCTVYRTNDSMYAASTGILKLELQQYKKWKENDAKLIQNLKIKLKQVENVSTHAAQTDQSIKINLKDTVYVKNKGEESGKKFRYKTPYIKLDGILGKDSIQINMTSYDTLKQVVYRVPKKFLFIKYGTKAIRQEVVSTNPHTRITYTQYIQIKKPEG